MNPTKTDDETGEQQSKQTDEQGGETPLRPPAAAAKRDVEEAEKKAEQAHRRAVEEAESVRAEVSELVARLDDVDDVVDVLDERVRELQDIVEHPASRTKLVPDEPARETVQERRSEADG
jgi:hypothetical protein